MFETPNFLYCVFYVLSTRLKNCHRLLTHSKDLYFESRKQNQDLKHLSVLSERSRKKMSRELIRRKVKFDEISEIFDFLVKEKSRLKFTILKFSTNGGGNNFKDEENNKSNNNNNNNNMENISKLVETLKEWIEKTKGFYRCEVCLKRLDNEKDFVICTNCSLAKFCKNHSKCLRNHHIENDMKDFTICSRYYKVVDHIANLLEEDEDKFLEKIMMNKEYDLGSSKRRIEEILENRENKKKRFSEASVLDTLDDDKINPYSVMSKENLDSNLLFLVKEKERVNELKKKHFELKNDGKIMINFLDRTITQRRKILKDYHVHKKEEKEKKERKKNRRKFGKFSILSRSLQRENRREDEADEEKEKLDFLLHHKLTQSVFELMKRLKMKEAKIEKFRKQYKKVEGNFLERGREFEEEKRKLDDQLIEIQGRLVEMKKNYELEKKRRIEVERMRRRDSYYFLGSDRPKSYDDHGVQTMANEFKEKDGCDNILQMKIKESIGDFRKILFDLKTTAITKDEYFKYDISEFRKELLSILVEEEGKRSLTKEIGVQTKKFKSKDQKKKKKNMLDKSVQKSGIGLCNTNLFNVRKYKPPTHQNSKVSNNSVMGFLRNEDEILMTNIKNRISLVERGRKKGISEKTEPKEFEYFRILVQDYHTICKSQVLDMWRLFGTVCKIQIQSELFEIDSEYVNFDMRKRNFAMLKLFQRTNLAVSCWKKRKVMFRVMKRQILKNFLDIIKRRKRGPSKGLSRRRFFARNFKKSVPEKKDKDKKKKEKKKKGKKKKDERKIEKSQEEKEANEENEKKIEEKLKDFNYRLFSHHISSFIPVSYFCMNKMTEYDKEFKVKITYEQKSRIEALSPFFAFDFSKLSNVERKNILLTVLKFGFAKGVSKRERKANKSVLLGKVLERFIQLQSKNSESNELLKMEVSKYCRTMISGSSFNKILRVNTNVPIFSKLQREIILGDSNKKKY